MLSKLEESVELLTIKGWREESLEKFNIFIC